MDVNDNKPTFATISESNFKTYNNLKQDITLTSSIKENEIGPIIFDNLNSFIVYDLDLNENSTFLLHLNQLKSNNKGKEALTKKQINSFFKINRHSSSLVKSKASIDLFNYSPIDYESLESESIINQTSGIGTKTIKFLVN
jgi:hypothetical protein